jgi:RNA polymerase sigma-70 factor (ECF subfamily)
VQAGHFGTGHPVPLRAFPTAFKGEITPGFVSTIFGAWSSGSTGTISIPRMTEIRRSMDKPPATDAELVSGIQAGDESAGADLFERYSKRVYYLALRELRSTADAEDVRAETFFRVLKAIQAGQVTSPDALRLFIRGTARNIILETLRSPLRAARDEVPELPAPELPGMVDDDVRGAIQEAIRRLKPREREFLRLHYYEDLPKEEIARRIGVDEERVRLIKSRCLKSFREIYQRLRGIADKKIADTKRGGPSLRI